MKTLTCPACGSRQLTWLKTVLHHREPDASFTKKVTVGNDGNVRLQTVASFDSGNPSPREDGMLLHLACPACNESFRWELAHNKGEIEIQWCERGRRFEYERPQRGLTEAEMAQTESEREQF